MKRRRSRSSTALLELGCTITAFDPAAMEEAKKKVGEAVKYCERQLRCAEGRRAR